MYHTTGFSREDIVDLCVMICADCKGGKQPWPPILGLHKSVVVALTYMRRIASRQSWRKRVRCDAC
jgi:hypothetical protein